MNEDNLDAVLYLTEDNWDDLIKEGKTFPVELVKSLVDRTVKYKRAVDFIIGGKLYGYTIECPHCGVSYDVGTRNFNFGKLISCMDCNNTYYQNQNIIDILCREDS